MKRSPIKRRVGRLKAKARLRKVSKKRAKRNREVKDFREDLKQEIGRCEICLTPAALLDCHEITGAWARQYTLDNRSCILVLCRSCHDEVELSPALWNVARQAALLRRRRAEDFCLATLNRFLTRGLDLEEVNMAARMLEDKTTVGRRERRTA